MDREIENKINKESVLEQENTEKVDTTFVAPETLGEKWKKARKRGWDIYKGRYLAALIWSICLILYYTVKSLIEKF